MRFTFIDLLLIVIFSQGIFLLVAIQLMPNKNKAANRALSVVLSIASIMLLGRILIYHIQNELVFRIGSGIDATIYLFGPYLYLYIRRMAFQEDKVYKLHWTHYILAAIYCGYFLWSIFVDVEVLRQFQRSVYIRFVHLFVELFGILSLGFYVFQSFKLYRVFTDNQASQVSFDQQVSKYLKAILIALTCFLVLWIVSFVSIYGFRNYIPFVNYNTMWISSALLMYFIGFYSLTQPHIFRISMPRKELNLVSKNRLKEDEIDDLKRNLEKAMQVEKAFLESDLSLSNLANHLGTTSNNLSWVLNNVYKQTFYEFVNYYRVQDFIQRINANQHQQLTLFSIALESGFNSKSTFNKAFKSVMNDTPSNYIKAQKNS